MVWRLIRKIGLSVPFELNDNTAPEINALAFLFTGFQHFKLTMYWMQCKIPKVC